MIVLRMPGTSRFERLAGRLRGESRSVEVHRFPDGERCVRITGTVLEEDAVLLGDLRPDDEVLSLLFAAATARDLGAVSLGLVSPYLPYLRQDASFRAGEGVTARYFARLLSQAVDWLVTVDPHLHRIPALSKLFDIPVETVHAAPVLAQWIQRHVEAPLILGPDAESIQWVADIARRLDAPYAVLGKRRTGDRRVEITLPDLTSHDGRHPVLVDDIISSGATMASAVRALRFSGWPGPDCVAIHALFAPGALEALSEAGAGRVVTANTVAHPSNAIDVQGLLSEAVSRRVGGAAAAMRP